MQLVRNYREAFDRRRCTVISVVQLPQLGEISFSDAEGWGDPGGWHHFLLFAARVSNPKLT